MNTQKFLVSGIVGGIVSFVGGYLVYGLLLMDFFAKHAGTATGVNRAMADFVWWSLVVGCIAQGLMLSYIFNKWANIRSAGAGLSAGAVIFFFMTAGYDLIMYASSNLSTLTGVCADTICSAVMGALIGASVGWMNGRGNKEAQV